MKKTVTFTESELVKVVSRIVESYSDDTYDDEDYAEVFLNYFRPWIKKTHGDEIGQYPLSYLVKKYMSDFVTDYGMRPESVIYGYRNNLTNVVNIGRNLVKQGKHKLPSLRSPDKFTEKFKRPLEFFLNELNLPDFIKIEFIENTPYKVDTRLVIDWEKLIRYEGDELPKPDEIKKELESRIKSFLGVELGNPTHGQLRFSFGSPEYIGVDEWVKKSLNKEIKKSIRALPKAHILHAIKFETKSYELGGQLKFSFKGWNGRNDFMKEVKSLLQNMGYNTKILRAYS